jgi:hypothetical protein
MHMHFHHTLLGIFLLQGHTHPGHQVALVMKLVYWCLIVVGLKFRTHFLSPLWQLEFRGGF